MDADASTRARPRARLPLQMLSIGVLVGVVALAVAGYLVTRSVVSDQERKLLKQRTDEIGLVLGSISTYIQGELAPLVTAATVPGANFATTARKLLAPPPGANFKYVALVSTAGTAHVVRSVGSTPDATLGAARLAAIQQAQAKSSGVGALVGTPLLGSGTGPRRIGFAFASPVLPDAAIYAESEVDPSRPSPVTASQPFSELVVAIYAEPVVHADQLLITTGSVKDLPLRGSIARSRTAVGLGPEWLLVAKARHPLVGSVATATPWAILVSGLVLAMFATAIVETLVRRRRYAVGLVDLRTRELQQSLTELAAAHDQLVRQERLAAIGELASTIGHELRNPLGVLSNAVYLLRTDLGPAPGEAAERHLATADRELSAATVIVSDLLEFARERQPMLDDVDVVALTDEVLSVLPPPSGIDVRRRVPRDALTLRADRDMLRQVLLNIMSNAYQAMPDGGVVDVSVTGVEGAVQIRVRDNGAGMTDEVASHIFEPFFTTKARGIGLGLAVTRRIVEAHGGDIGASSRPGEGTEFVVTLPLLVAPRRPSDGATSDAETASRPGAGATL